MLGSRSISNTHCCSCRTYAFSRNLMIFYVGFLLVSLYIGGYDISFHLAYIAIAACLLVFSTYRGMNSQQSVNRLYNFIDICIHGIGRSFGPLLKSGIFNMASILKGKSTPLLVIGFFGKLFLLWGSFSQHSARICLS